MDTGAGFISPYIYAITLCAKSKFSYENVISPYTARTSNFMALAFQLKAYEAQKLLPADVKSKSDDSGMASGGMEIYTTDQIYGVPGYTIAFLYVVVEGNKKDAPLMPIPWLANGNQTEVVSFQVRTGGNKWEITSQAR